jgi:hypothetical protein
LRLGVASRRVDPGGKTAGINPSARHTRSQSALARRPPGAALADPLRAEAHFGRLLAASALGRLRPHLGQLAALCEERRLLAVQERLHFWLHSWLLVHVPLAGALPVLLVAHVLSALYY